MAGPAADRPRHRDRRVSALPVQLCRARVRRVVRRGGDPSAARDRDRRPGQRDRVVASGASSRQWRHPRRLAPRLGGQRRRVRRSRSASSRRSPRSTGCGSGASSRPGPSAWPCSWRRRARGSAWPVSGRGWRPAGCHRRRQLSCETAMARSCWTSMSASGIEPRLGPSSMLDGVACFVELHVEQGTGPRRPGPCRRACVRELGARPLALRLRG